MGAQLTPLLHAESGARAAARANGLHGPEQSCDLARLFAEAELLLVFDLLFG